MADAALLAPTATANPHSAATAGRSAAGRARLDLACAMCGLSSLGWAAASLWPGLAVPSWPAASAGLVALALAGLPGNVGPKAIGTLAGFGGLLASSLKILMLWGLTLALS